MEVGERIRTGRAARIRAVLALLAGTLGVVVLAVAMLSAPVLLVAGVACAALGLNATALALTTRHRGRRLAGAVAALVLGGGLVAVVVAWLTRPDADLPVLVAIALVVAAAALARSALQPPPAFDPSNFDVPRHRWPASRPCLIVNPHSGDGKAEQFGLVERARDLGIHVEVLGPDDDLVALAQAAVADGADALGMAGGDGSLGLVAEVAMQRDVPFVCVPAGTRNHFALDVGLDRTDPVRALAAFTAGYERRVDVGVVAGRTFLNNVSLGLYAAAVARPEYRDRKLDTVLTVLPDAVEAGDPSFDLCFDLPDDEHWDRATLVLVSNGAYELAPRRAAGRRRHLDLGELGVVALQADSPAALGTLSALAAVGVPERSSDLHTWAAPTFEVSSPHDELDVGLDGEHVRLPTPLRFESRPGALRLLVPPGARVGLAAQDRGSEGPLGGLLGVILDPTG